MKGLYQGNRGIRFNGSKGKCPEIVEVIQSLIKRDSYYWEPFLGAGKIMQSIRCRERAGSDIDPHIITLLQEIQNGWQPPNWKITEEQYQYWNKRRKKHPDLRDPMIGFIGYGCSFGARFFEGYARSKKGEVDFGASARMALLRQKPFLRGVTLACRPYNDQHTTRFHPDFLKRLIIYADPPYEGTKRVGRGDKFDSEEFWKWCRNFMAAGATVVVSEYKCPLDHVVLWEKKVAAGIRFGTGGDGGAKGSGKKKHEKLFCLNPKVARRIGLGILE